MHDVDRSIFTRRATASDKDPRVLKSQTSRILVELSFFGYRIELAHFARDGAHVRSRRLVCALARARARACRCWTNLVRRLSWLRRTADSARVTHGSHPIVFVPA